MMLPHIPDLDAFEANPNAEMRFYAMSGVLLSLHAAIERGWFTAFRRGLKLSEDDAARIFYKVKSEDARKAMADEAMKIRLAGKPLLAEWGNVFAAMKQGGARNLISHNPAHRQVHPPFAWGVSGAGWGSGGWGSGGAITMQVEQDPVQVKAGTQKSKRTTAAALRADCDALISTLRALDALLARRF